MTQLANKQGVAAAAARALHTLCLAHAPNVRRALRLGLVPALTACMAINMRCVEVWFFFLGGGGDVAGADCLYGY